MDRRCSNEGWKGAGDVWCFRLRPAEPAVLSVARRPFWAPGICEEPRAHTYGSTLPGRLCGVCRVHPWTSAPKAIPATVDNPTTNAA
jgi:hypothetical protein